MHATPYSYSVVPVIINTRVASVHTTEIKVALKEFNVKLLYFVWRQILLSLSRSLLYVENKNVSNADFESAFLVDGNNK